MSTESRWRRYLRFARPDVGADVDEELEFHVAMRTERNIALGMAHDDARREAHARFGDVSLVRHVLVDHDTRKQNAVGRREYMADFMQDLRFGWRSLLRAPTFAITAVLTLAIGIGANAAIFSLVNAVVLRPLPFAHPEQLVYLGDGSGGEFVALRERLRSFAGLATIVTQTHPIDDGEQAVRLEGASVTPNLFRLLGVAPAVGRDFRDDEGVLGANQVMVISHRLWRTRFGGSRDVIGKRVMLEGAPFEIVGVMPETFQFPDRNTQYWQPYAFNPANMGLTWAVGGKSFVGRLASGVTMAAADRELRDVWPTLRRLNPLWDPGDEYGRDARITPLQTEVVGSAGTVLWLLFGCVVVVLLIGCVNVANLLLARATARERELAVRAALGGGRARLVRQLVTESLLLSTIGAALGTAFAFAGVRWLVAVMPAGVPRAHEISVSGAVLLFSAATAVITAVLFGMIPALRATRFSSRAGGMGVRTTAGVQHHRVSGLLVGAEVALAVTLVIGSLLLVRSFQALRNVEPGFQPSRVMAARVSPPSLGYRDPARIAALYTAVLERLGAVPGVEEVAAVDKLPLAQSIWGAAVRVEGQFEDGTRLLPDIGHFQQVTPGYFATLRIPLKRGRAFTAADRDSQPAVAIVSESFAKKFWPKEDAIGKRIGYAWPSPWITIVGVVADTKQDSLRDTLSTSLYVPWEQRTRMSGSEMWVLARTSSDPAALARSIRAIVADVDRSVPVSDVQTMQAVLDGSMDKTRFTTLLVGGFALAALLLGAVGIYGVMSYLVSQRAQEMGIRMALGARPAQVQGMVVRRGATLAAAGTVVGLLAAVFATRSLGSLLYGISVRDPVTFAVVPLIFLVVAVVASYSPARRATKVDPARALRAE